ncbi:hypothetical protein [Novipirellula artificiosorum]|uniref:Uncharacterized protein n=1 Tax=Novipirellula artificiosorum TaxID=2528016 RepID=A0A5C6CZ50_9BACT|nr:hypothetical protein [Novipirellula artificiosorum]TWU27939.1 hypothetical protein Poly41_70130 [Novipirellula artificiosorum]
MFRVSIRSIAFATTAFALFSAYIAVMAHGGDTVRGDLVRGYAIGMLAIGSLAGSILAVTATSASLAYDVNPTRASCEAGAFWGFVVFTILGILIGLVPFIG